MEVPANQPVRFELLDANGQTIGAERSWIWTRPGEQRGCTGCHGDKAMAPDNRWPLTLKRFDTPTRSGRRMMGQKQPPRTKISRRLVCLAAAMLGWRSHRSRWHRSPASRQSCQRCFKVAHLRRRDRQSELEVCEFVWRAEAQFDPGIDGTGCAWFDYNNDGLLDLYVLSGRYLDGVTDHSKPDGKDATNHLFRNNGDGTFTDVTDKPELPAKASPWA